MDSIGHLYLNRKEPVKVQGTEGLLQTNANDEYHKHCLDQANNGKAGKVFQIIVEGNIGSGKTTFLDIFAKNCGSFPTKPLVVPEPIDKWRNVHGNNIFQLLANDMNRWSFSFQSYVQLTMAKIHKMVPESGKGIKLMERSLYSARYCFVENLRNKNLIQPVEYCILDEWFQEVSQEVSIDLIIYLQTDPDVVHERIRRRGRPEEEGLTLDYLRSLHELHEAWLIEKKFGLPAPVWIIDANKPLEEILSEYEQKTTGILREHVLTSQLA